MSEQSLEEDTPIKSARLERAYLGELLLSFEPNTAAIDIPHEYFSNVSHQLIFKAVKTIIKEEKSATPAKVIEFLREEGALQTAGGQDYIYEIVEDAGASLENSLEIKESIIKHYKLRLIANTANAALLAAAGADGDLSYAETRTRELLNLLETRKKKKSITTSAFAGITSGARETFRPAVKTGWKKMDDFVRMSPGRLIVLGARPGIGKTTLSVQLSTQMLCLNKETHILYCSVEMDASEIGLKSLSMLTSVDCVTPFQLSNEKLMDDVLNLAKTQESVMDRMHIFYGTRIDKLVNIANAITEEHKLGLVVVDFISSMKPTEEHGTRTEAIGSVSKALKALAKELQVPVLACSQLNRGTNANRRPSMKDLRDSGEIEQDADIVMLLHRDSDEETELLIEKNRFGILGEIRLEPQLQYHRFRIVN